MSFETILIEKKDQLGIIALSRPQKFNTFSSQMAEELNAALHPLDEDNEVRVVIIKGAGKVFSRGIDVSEFHGKTPSEYHKWLTLMDQMHLTIASMGKPVIAMVHGYAVANGADLWLQRILPLRVKELKLERQRSMLDYSVPGLSFP
jgi:enoyl-CoA hydratase/carnithine racemase